MTMTVSVTNHSIDEQLFNQFCFMLQMAMPGGKRTEDGVKFPDIHADDPIHMPGYDPPIVSVETFYRRKIREVCERTSSLNGWPPNMALGYLFGVTYTDIRPSLFCADMQTDITEGYPVCKRKDCPKVETCSYIPEKAGGDDDGGGTVGGSGPDGACPVV